MSLLADKSALAAINRALRVVGLFLKGISGPLRTRFPNKEFIHPFFIVWAGQGLQSGVSWGKLFF